MIFQSFKMALKAIAGNKMRSFLTILGVVIGVLAIVVLVSIGQGANSSVTASIEGMGTNLISATINARRTNPVTADGLNELAENEAIAYIAPLTNVSGTVKAGVNTYDDGTVQGTAPGYEHIRNWTVAEGRFLTQPDVDNRSFVAVIGAEAASEMYGTTHAVGETFTLSGYTMTVVGVLKANGESASGSNDNQILIPYTLAQRLSNSTGISLLVGGIGIMNIMLVSVSERTREIGIRKAIGAARGNILMQFLIEALVVSLMGGLLGLALSVGLVKILGPILDMTLTVPINVAWMAIGFSVLIGVVFGLYPANKASKLKPIEALHYEG